MCDVIENFSHSTDRTSPPHYKAALFLHTVLDPCLTWRHSSMPSWEAEDANRCKNECWTRRWAPLVKNIWFYSKPHHHPAQINHHLWSWHGANKPDSGAKRRGAFQLNEAATIHLQRTDIGEHAMQVDVWITQLIMPIKTHLPETTGLASLYTLAPCSVFIVEDGRYTLPSLTAGSWSRLCVWVGARMCVCVGMCARGRCWNLDA